MSCSRSITTDILSLSVLNTRSVADIGVQSLVAGLLEMWFVSLQVLLLYSFSIFFRAQRSTPHILLTPAVSAGLLLGSRFTIGVPLLTPHLALFMAVIESFCFNSTVISKKKGRFLFLTVNKGNQLLAGADTLIARVV